MQPAPLLQGGSAERDVLLGPRGFGSVAHLGSERITVWTGKGTFFPKADEGLSCGGGRGVNVPKSVS